MIKNAWIQLAFVLSQGLLVTACSQPKSADGTPKTQTETSDPALAFQGERTEESFCETSSIVNLPKNDHEVDRQTVHAIRHMKPTSDGKSVLRTSQALNRLRTHKVDKETGLVTAGESQTILINSESEITTTPQADGTIIEVTLIKRTSTSLDGRAFLIRDGSQVQTNTTSEKFTNVFQKHGNTIFGLSNQRNDQEPTKDSSRTTIDYANGFKVETTVLLVPESAQPERQYLAVISSFEVCRTRIVDPGTKLDLSKID